MNTNESYFTTLSPPSLLKLSTSDGKASVTIDIFIAWRALVKNSKLPSEDQRWQANKEYLADLLQVSSDQVSESMAREFSETVIKLGAKAEDLIAKKVEGMLS